MGGISQRPTGMFWVWVLAQDGGHPAVVDGAGQPVGAQQESVSGSQDEALRIGPQLAVHPDVACQLVPAGMSGRLLFGDLASVDKRLG